MGKDKVLVGYYGDWSRKTSSEKAKAYQEEAGNDYAEVKAELEAIAGHTRLGPRPEIEVTKEQQMIRDLQSIFCTGRYRSWACSVGKRSTYRGG
jgi:hypothetical protein